MDIHRANVAAGGGAKEFSKAKANIDFVSFDAMAEMHRHQLIRAIAPLL